MIDLYRFFDIDGNLLYVGISLHAATRASAHRSTKSWWGDVARMDVEHLATNDTAEAETIEAAVIRSEHPRHNVTHNRGRDPREATSRRERRLTRVQWGAIEARRLGLPEGHLGDERFACMHRRREWVSQRQFGWRRCRRDAIRIDYHPRFGPIALCGNHRLADLREEVAA